MADLSDRGQMILIAGFALAVTFVALALVVNSAIFTENLASRGDTAGAGDALVLRDSMEDAVGVAVGAANVYNTTDGTALRDGVEEGYTNTTEAVEVQHATRGAFVSVSWDRSDSSRYEMGSRIAQNDSSTFESAGGLSEWLVVDDVSRESATTNGTRAFELNASTLPTSAGDAFTVVVNTTAATDVTWEVDLWTDGTDIHAEVATGTGETNSCLVPDPGEPVHIHLTRGTIDGEPCDALRNADVDGDGTPENFQFGAGVPDPYNITFENGDQIEGNYSLVTTNKSISTATTLNNGAGAASPFGTDAVYSVTVSYQYHGRDVRYEADVRVAPGENP